MLELMYKTIRIPWKSCVAIVAAFVCAHFFINVTPPLNERFLSEVPRPLNYQRAASRKGSPPHSAIGVNDSVDKRSSLNLPIHNFRNCLPNAYLYPILAEHYKTSVLAFFHNPKSGGTSMKNCMQLLYRAMHKDRPILVTKHTAAEEKEKLLNHVTPTKDYYMGGSAVGICDSIEDRPCSYFTVVREPYERMVSHYYFCKSGRRVRLSCNNTLEEFAMSVGSLFFRQLSFRVFCKEDTQNASSPWKCNKMQRILGHSPALQQQRTDLLDFYLANIDKLFAVIGLTEEFETSLKLFENTFGEPFHKLCNRMHSNTGSYKRVNDTYDTRERIIAKAKERLMRNDEIRQCLHEDIQLYNKMYKIFQKQKESFKIY